MANAYCGTVRRLALATLFGLGLTSAGLAQDDSPWVRDRGQPRPAAASDPVDIRPGPGRQDPVAAAPQEQGETYSQGEIKSAGHQFFGSVSQALARVIEHAFRKKGRPNGYILGEEAGGAFIAGVRYGEGTLYTKNAGNHKVFWQGPSLGFDVGAEGSRTMVLVYNMREVGELFAMYGGIAGSAYVIGGVGITYLARDHVTLAPIRSGVGLRLGANFGYLKYTRVPTWNPF